MGITAKDTGGGQDFEVTPEGFWQGICFGVYDLGTQHFTIKGKEQVKHQVLVQWELPDARIDFERDGEFINLPRAISKKYNLSLHEKATLRKHLKSWRGRDFTPEELEGFDVSKLLGANCEIQVIHNTTNDKIYANVENVIPLRDKSLKKISENKQSYFSFEEHTSIPPNTPDWIAKLIQDADEWGSGTAPTQDDEGPPPQGDDEIPF